MRMPSNRVNKTTEALLTLHSRFSSHSGLTRQDEANLFLQNIPSRQQELARISRLLSRNDINDGHEEAYRAANEIMIVRELLKLGSDEEVVAIASSRFPGAQGEARDVIEAAQQVLHDLSERYSGVLAGYKAEDVAQAVRDIREDHQDVIDLNIQKRRQLEEGLLSEQAEWFEPEGVPDEQIDKILSFRIQFEVMRRSGNVRSYSSTLNPLHRAM